MAKRFLDTSFYKSPFVRGLKAPYKGLYLFIICDCEGSGIWAADFEAASLYVGQTVDKAGFEKNFVESGKAIDLLNGKYFLPDFIEHQYPGGLSEKNIAHKNFILELTKYQLLDNDLKPLRSPLQGSNVMVKVKAEVKATVFTEKNSTNKIPPVEEFMAYYHSDIEKTFPNLSFQVKAKYEAWVDNGWKDGNNKKITNWKSKLKNTVSFLKPTFLDLSVRLGESGSTPNPRSRP